MGFGVTERQRMCVLLKCVCVREREREHACVIERVCLWILCERERESVYVSE